MNTAPPPKIGLILAAGFGSRLQDETGPTRLKPLTPVAGEPLIIRAIGGLHRSGCARVVIVVGFEGEKLQEEVEAAYTGDAELVFVVNENYSLKNGCSVLAAREHLKDTFLMVMADHIVGRSVMQLAGAHRPPADGGTLLVDFKLETIFDMDDATKVEARDGRIHRIGKEIDGYNCVDTGVFVCTEALIERIAAVYDKHGDASLSDGVQALARDGLMHVLDIGDGFWQDVDTPEMLGHAEAALSGNSQP